MKKLTTVEKQGLRVLTSKQIAECYEVDKKQIRQNFKNNRKHFVEGKHYICLVGTDLKEFKNRVENFDLVERRANILYLWTEKGALLHAKSLNTNKAWEVYDYLVDFYFRAKEVKQNALVQEAGRLVVNVPENAEILNAIQKIEDDITAMKVLLENCKMYISEETFKERRRATSEIVSLIIKDMTLFLGITPVVIRKQI